MEERRKEREGERKEGSMRREGDNKGVNQPRQVGGGGRRRRRRRRKKKKEREKRKEVKKEKKKEEEGDEGGDPFTEVLTLPHPRQ